jgi:hypothetical protein
MFLKYLSTIFDLTCQTLDMLMTLNAIVSVSHEPTDSPLQSATVEMCDRCNINGVVTNIKKTQ